MRAAMTPEEFRAAGRYLNGGRRRGWRKRLALLLATPEPTIAAWATRSPGNARPIPGVAATMVKLLTALLRQEAALRGDLAAAAETLTAEITALTRAPAPLPPIGLPILRLEPRLPSEQPSLSVPHLSSVGHRSLERKVPRPQKPAALEGTPIESLAHGNEVENRPR